MVYAALGVVLLHGGPAGVQGVGVGDQGARLHLVLLCGWKGPHSSYIKMLHAPLERQHLIQRGHTILQNQTIGRKKK